MKSDKILVNSKGAKYILYSLASIGAVVGFVAGLNIGQSIVVKIVSALILALVCGGIMLVLLYIPVVFVEALFIDKSDRERLKAAKSEAYYILGNYGFVGKSRQFGLRDDFLTRKPVVKNRDRLNEIIDILYDQQGDECEHLLRDLLKLEEELNSKPEQ